MTEGPHILLIMRHAKSAWPASAPNDHDRPLNDRGRRAARRVGAHLAARQTFPDLIWSSDAQRTRETAAGLLVAGKACTVRLLPEFYHASAQSVLLKCQENGPPPVNCLMLLGHNPGWEDLIHFFSGQSFRMVTGACAIFTRPKAKPGTDWLTSEFWELSDFILPRALDTGP